MFLKKVKNKRFTNVSLLTEYQDLPATLAGKNSCVEYLGKAFSSIDDDFLKIFVNQCVLINQ